MKYKIDQFQKRRLINSYLSVIISITFVLFILGLFGFIVLKTNTLSSYFREQVSLNLFISDTASDEDITQWQQKLKTESYIKSISYTNKKQAAEMMKEEMGEDFIDILGTNPLKNRVELKLKSNYVTITRIDSIKQVLTKDPIIYEIQYNKNLITKLNKNLDKLSYWVFLLTAILVVITTMLINNTMRLSIHSKRFTIKTMQMVGATKSFIRRPFVFTGIKLGIISAILATAILILLNSYFEKHYQTFKVGDNINDYLTIFAGLLLIGIVITWVSTSFAIHKFLNLKTNQLYY